MPTLDEVLNPDWYAPRRPQARHRALGRPQTGLYARTAATLAAARHAAREGLTDALTGSGTPAGGLTLLSGAQQHGRTS
jgi:hypothetical protein